MHAACDQRQEDIVNGAVEEVQATSCTPSKGNRTKSTARAAAIGPFRDDLGATMRGVTMVPNARARSANSPVRRIGRTRSRCTTWPLVPGSPPSAADPLLPPARPAREGMGPRGDRLVIWGRLGRQVEENSGQLGGGQPVSHGVMESLDESNTTLAQTFEKGQIPQWASPVQRN